VRCARIDQLAQERKIRRPVKLIKIDVEGFECAALDGMQRVIAEDRPFVVTEVNPLMLRPNHLTSVDLLGRIVSHDYLVYRLWERRGLLNGGMVRLELVDPRREIDFCDVVCVPGERRLPLDLLVGQGGLSASGRG